ncbi:membrane alanyl aminopeptidase-like [Lucilia cuprina]|uniref:membrane alanyl aminopeptidase-like n=1 Tax=Lucilia cuprina TaxID=7375 RepID=UPI001F060362|nr:membrane alanyl aminopeptidase-like [Lucilia cuprina]
MSPIYIATILVACLCLTYAAPFAEEVQTPVPAADVNYRLPLNIKPINYNINLKPYLNETHPKAFKFDGECYVEIQAQQNTKEIQLHIKNLNITVSEYYKKDTPSAKKNLPTATPNSLTDIVVYTLNEELQANVSYILHYVYTGSMDDDMHGFYRSYYKTANNVTKWLGSTQFQRNHARRAFPSFDEPKFKATYDLSLTRHRSLRSAGPTRLIEIKPNGEYVTDVYDTTPKMSTYILAFIVSEFNDRYDGEFGVLARPEYYSQTEYIFDAGKKLLKALDDYMGIPYYSMGNDKMHLAAIPDFSAGAMENWGLLTFRERALLYDEEHSALSSKQYIAAIVAHEQAHMWWGDLVTCDWWSYTWLNEGFASYFQYFGTHMVEEHMQMDKQFVVDYVQTVMGMDATNATNPMSDEDTNTPEETGRMFNSISYNKGATFIRMTKYILGEEKFKTSLNDYLKTHSYTNTIPSDLFTIWKKYWPAEFAQYADAYFASFTTQVGYPVVTFNRTSATEVEISQKRFLLKDFDTADPKLTYTVPITYTTSAEKNFENASPKFFLTQTPKTVTVNKDATWVMGNIQESGYYRVNYDTKSWHQIHHKLYSNNWDGIHELNRAQVVDDLLNLARSGEMEYSLAFDVLSYLETETNYLPWTSAFNSFNYLNIRLGTDTQDFAAYIRHLTNKAYNKLGFEEKKDDTTLDIYNRAKILAWSCKFGNSECIAKAKSYFNKNLKADPVPVNIRSVVYCTAMREGNEEDFNKLYTKYKTETVATEETLILNNLGCVKDSKLVSRFFHMVASDEVRRQDKSSALSSLYSENNENVEPVFDLVDQNVEKLANSMGGYSSVASVVSNIASRFTTDAQLQKLKDFNGKHKDKFGSSISTLENAVKTVEFNLKWSKEKLGAVKSFLQQYGTNGAAINSISLVTLVVVALIAMIFH